jgi:hypothetical protein
VNVSVYSWDFLTFESAGFLFLKAATVQLRPKMKCHFSTKKKTFAENTWSADSTVRIDKTTNGKEVSLEELTKNTCLFNEIIFI